MPGWRQQYDRIKRWQARLAESAAVDERRIDDFYAFFVFCYHLVDWIENDNSIQPRIRTAARAHVRNDHSLRMCADITNGVKHFVRKRPAKVDPTMRVEKLPAWAQKGLFQANMIQQEQVIVAGVATKLSALRVAEECVKAWESFLRSHGLIA